MQSSETEKKRLETKTTNGYPFVELVLTLAWSKKISLAVKYSSESELSFGRSKLTTDREPSMATPRD